MQIVKNDGIFKIKIDRDDYPEIRQKFENEITFPSSYFGDWKIPINKFNPNNIEKVIFNPPATIVIFKDGSKQVVKCAEGEEYDPELGFAQAMMNVMFGSRSKFSKFIKKFIKEEK